MKTDSTMKKILTICVLLSVAISAGAQGKFSFGVNINPLATSSNWQPEDGAFSGDFLNDNVGKVPAQMYILAKDPVASFKIRYHMSEHSAIRFQLGTTGSIINHKEYVRDDHAVYINPDSQAQVVDVITSKLNATSLGLALEWLKGEGPLKFNASLGVIYAIAGGSMDFTYGNPFNKDWNGNVPTSNAFTQKAGVAAELNDGYPAGKLGITYARPLTRFNVGYTSAVGVTLDMGVEWFMAEKISLGAAVTFTPVMYMMQPETYTTYEGYTTYPLEGGNDLGGIVQYNKLVSPGSNAILYGTSNFGLRLSLNYYL